MNFIKLKTDGLITCGDNPIADDPLGYLGYQIFLEEGVTLRGFFTMFEHYPDLKRLNAFFPKETKALVQHLPDKTGETDIQCLELRKTVEMIGFPGPPKLETYVSFTGVYKSEAVDLKHFNTTRLLDIPIRLGKLKHVIFGDKVDEFDFEGLFTFFEFIDGILWELGFQTGPASCNIRPS